MSEIARRRLHAQGLAGNPFPSVVDAVRALTAVQAQDYGAAKWGLGQRLAGTTDRDLDAVFDQGAVLRTHVMRPTWHFVLPEDLRWMAELTGRRLVDRLAGRRRDLELDEATLNHATSLLMEALGGANWLTRPELAEVLGRASISTAAQRLPHLLLHAEAQGLIVSGPRRGREMTYALVEERTPASAPLDRDEALCKLAGRYFQSHGPARIEDLVWWSGLTTAEARRGVAGAGSALRREVLEGAEYWSGSGPEPSRRPEAPAVHLLPNFDEFTVAYRHRGALVPVDTPIEPGLFSQFRDASATAWVISNVMTVDGVVRGAWRRTLRRGAVSVDVKPLEPLRPGALEALEGTVRRLGVFLGTSVSLRLV